MTTDKKPRAAKLKNSVWEFEGAGEERRFRVRPSTTGEAKPIVIDADVGLEAEADAMGAMAMRTEGVKRSKAKQRQR